MALYSFVLGFFLYVPCSRGGIDTEIGSRIELELDWDDDQNVSHYNRG